jgi:hypothetical protein
MKHTPEFQRAIKRYIFALRDQPEAKATALEFVAEVEKELAVCELQINEMHETIKSLIENEKLLLDVLQMYGVSLDKLGGKPVTQLKATIEDCKELGHFVIPENLRQWKQ